MINIGLEGLMLISACVTSLAASSFGMVLGLLAGIGSAVLLSLLHWLVTQIYRIDQVISGMAINALAIGGTNFLFHKLDPDSSGHAPSLPPVAFEALACIAPFALWLYARGTRGGLRLQAVGADPDKSRLAGLQPIKIRLAALVATGLFAGMSCENRLSWRRKFSKPGSSSMPCFTVSIAACRCPRRNWASARPPRYSALPGSSQTA